MSDQFTEGKENVIKRIKDTLVYTENKKKEFETALEKEKDLLKGDPRLLRYYEVYTKDTIETVDAEIFIVEDALKEVRLEEKEFASIVNTAERLYNTLVDTSARQAARSYTMYDLANAVNNKLGESFNKETVIKETDKALSDMLDDLVTVTNSIGTTTDQNFKNCATKLKDCLEKSLTEITLEKTKLVNDESPMIVSFSLISHEINKLHQLGKAEYYNYSELH